MRTKTILLTAALSVATVATSMADVFSVNVVGYVNVTVPPGFSMIANPLQGETNTVGVLFANAPLGTVLYDFDSVAGLYSPNSRGFAGWQRPDDVLVPGGGYFISNPAATNLVFTFVGEVVQGPSTNAIPAGFSIQSSVWPSSGALDSALSFPKVLGDVVYVFDNASASYIPHSVGFGGNFNPAAPQPAVGQAFFVYKNTATNWVQEFSVE